jgi:putative ABC transport system permease protein
MRRRRPQGAADRLLKALIRLLPAEFRYDFGHDIDADIGERRRSRDGAGTVLHESAGLAAAVIREHASALRQDLNYTFRTIRRTPGFTAMAIVMLALGTGVSVALFSIIDAVLLHSPFREPDRIVKVLDVQDRKTPTGAVPADKYAQLAEAPGPFEAVAAFTGGGTHMIRTGGSLRRLEAECVSASMADVLGTAPLIGRWFNAAEDQPGAAPVMVLSYAYWKRLGGLTSIRGTTLVVNQTPVTVIGVMPRYFAGPFSRSDDEAWVPMNRPIAGGGTAGCPPSSTTSNVFARIAAGLSLEQAQSRLDGVALQALEDDALSGIRQKLLALAGAVACVLLIACFNVGGLQMERSLARRREMAVRVALGASRFRLIRQMLTENLVLAFAGGIAGVAAAWSALRTIVSLMPGYIPYLDEVEINVRVLVMAIAVASAAGVTAGLLPVLYVRRIDPAHDLASGRRTSERQRSLMRRMLVVTEIALSVLVLISALLMIRTFVTLRPARPGVDPAHKVSTRVSLQADSPDARRRFVALFFDAARQITGVHAVTATTYLPLSGSIGSERVVFAGESATIVTGRVTGEFFGVMRIPILAGRSFSSLDAGGALPVAIVDETFARRIRPDGRVVGDRIAVPLRSTPGGPPVEREIVGVVASTRYTGGDTRERNTLWLPYLQDPVNFIHVIVESDGRPDIAIARDLRRTVERLKPDVASFDPLVLTAMVDRSVANWRFGAWLLGAFAGFSVLLAAMGLMMTMGWWVRQRMQELGIRMALGATTAEIARLVGGHGLMLAAGGIALGAIGAVGATRYLRAWLYGITPLDPLTFTAGTAAMLVVAGVAMVSPIRRATRVDPISALRADDT